MGIEMFAKVEAVKCFNRFEIANEDLARFVLILIVGLTHPLSIEAQSRKKVFVNLLSSSAGASEKLAD